MGVRTKTIVFAASITHSQHIVEQFTNAGISAAYIDGKMGTKERERILSAWRTPELDVVSNCQILCLDEKKRKFGRTQDGMALTTLMLNRAWRIGITGSIFLRNRLIFSSEIVTLMSGCFSIHHHSARV